MYCLATKPLLRLCLTYGVLFSPLFAATNSAVFQKLDATTQGNWKGVYGQSGYMIPNDSNSQPSFGTVSASTTAVPYTWVASSTDVRAPLKGSSSTDRIASVFYTSSSYTFDINLTDGQSHPFALYCLDLDYGGRTQRVTISDASTNAVLDTRNMSGFQLGVYAVWSIQGHVSVQVTYTGGLNAVVSGLFIGPGSTSNSISPPLVSMTSPSGGTVSGTVSLVATASSSASVASVQFLLDGSAVGSALTASPYSMQWDTTTSANGTHTLSALAKDTLGQSTTSSVVSVSVSNAASSAPVTFVKFDNTTSGAWKGVYGGDGYAIANDTTSLPSYAKMSTTGASLYTWLPSTTDTRALQKGASTTDRIASTYYSYTSFTFDVTISDGQSHQVALYALDIDSTSRIESIAISDATTNSLLDTRSLSGFHNGMYAVWNVRGHVVFTVTCTGGLNAVVSALFFGGAGAVTNPAPVISLTAPSASSTVSGNVTLIANATAAAGMSSVQFLLDGASLGAAVSGTGPGYSTQWISTSGTNGSHTLSATAKDVNGQTATASAVSVTVSNAVVTPNVSGSFVKLDSTTQGNWRGVYGQDGYYIPHDSAVAPAWGTINTNSTPEYTWISSSSDARALLKGASATDRIASTYYSGSNFTIDVNPSDTGVHQLAVYFWDFEQFGRTETVSIVNASTNAVLDTRSLANFQQGVYAVWNIQGHVLIQVTNTNSNTNAVVGGVFVSSSTSAYAPPVITLTSPANGATVFGTTTIAATASASAGLSSVQFKVDGANLGSPILSSGPTVSTQWTTASFTNASHTITAIATDSIGQQGSAVARTVTVANTNSSAAFLGTDWNTIGSWKGVYGQNGYMIAGDSNSPPAYASVTMNGAGSYTWLSSTNEARTPLKGSSTTDHIASAYYASNSFTFDVTLTDGQMHKLSIYLLDYDGQNRTETVSISDPASGVVFDTQNAASFLFGEYLSWNAKGHVLVTVTRTGPLNAVATALFFDPSANPAALQISTSALSFSGISNGTSPVAQSIGVTNTGNGSMSWTATRTQSWLTLSPSSGTAPSTVSASVNLAGLAAGTYTDSITITAPGATLSPQTVSVTLTVAPPAAVLTLSNTVLSFTATAGDVNPAAQSVAISNSGGGTLSWAAAGKQAWLTLGSTSGSAPSNISVGVNTLGLTAGSYSDTVTVTGQAGSLGSPQTVAVSLRVSPPAGLVAKWTFEPATIIGSTVMDVSGNGLDAQITGGVTASTGKVGQGVTLDGTSGYLLTGPGSQAAMNGTLTLAAWVKTTNARRTESILSKFDFTGSEDGYILEVNASGYLALQLGGANISGNSLITDGVNRVNDGQWHHVAAIIRAGQDISFYVDGGLSSIYYLTTFNGAFGTAISIGGQVASLSNYFTGSVDDVRIYNRALSTDEITQLYGSTSNTVAGGQILYNGIAMPKNFPPPTSAATAMPVPYYINNPPRIIPIDVGRQLFVDDFLIEQTGLVRTQHQPAIAPNPVATGAPISGGAWYDPSSQNYKMWFYDTNAPNAYQYEYSADGKTWTKPVFSDVLVPNTDQVVPGGDTIWLDLQETNPSRRYKAFGVDTGALKIHVYFSPDGIHWTGPQAYDINTISDRTTVFWNPFRKVWVNSDRSSTGLDVRARYYSESPDLTTWTPVNPASTFWTGPDDHDPPYYLNNPVGEKPELYTLDGVAYESVMVGLFSWFYPGAGYRDYTLPGPVLVELSVGFSRDGFSWVRPTRGSGPLANGAFIPASNTAGTWNAYNTQSVGGGFLVVGDELWFYFSARSLKKPLDGNFSTGLATLRRDGFYSMDAGTTQGTLTTHPVSFSGSHMFVNVNDPGGVLKVEALDANGNVISGFSAANCTPLSVNSTLTEVKWSGASVASLAGQNVKFKFYLTNGSLYAFWVSSSTTGASNGYVAAGGPGFTTLTDTVGASGYPGGAPK